MGMKKMKANIRTKTIPDKSELIEANSNDAGMAFANALKSDKTIEWESRDVFLSSIRTNPDNALFRSLDEEEEIQTLAEDIKRNGLLHNLCCRWKDTLL